VCVYVCGVWHVWYLWCVVCVICGMCGMWYVWCVGFVMCMCGVYGMWYVSLKEKDELSFHYREPQKKGQHGILKRKSVYWGTGFVGFVFPPLADHSQHQA